MVLEGIKNIIFDLGWVLLNIDYKNTAESFKRGGLSNFDQLFSQAKQTDLFDKYETGKISSDEFRKKLRNYLGSAMNDEQIDKAWNTMLLDLPTKRLQLLESLKNKYRIFLLSNTNEIHIRCYSAMLQDKFGFSNLAHLFEKEYYSFEIGMRKPDAEIFEFVLGDNGLNADETLFIDDSLQHIIGAESVGMLTFHLAAGMELCELFM